VTYQPNATVRHRLRSTGWRLFLQQEGLGYGRGILRERYGLERGYAVGSWREVAAAGLALVRRAAARARGDELAFPLYDLIVRLGLRTGALRRELTRPLHAFRPAAR
jgi:hypothetical protein